jgi:putative tryptophan/tyrosine transport system substrate-binding protein
MASYLGRRKFLATLGGAAVAWPVAARAQQPAMPVIGLLDISTPSSRSTAMAGFRRGLRVCPKTSGGITKFSEHQAD